MDVVNLLFGIFIQSLYSTLIQLVMLTGPGLILGLIMNYLAKSIIIKSQSLIGRNGYLYLFGWLGVVVHEIGHALMCIVFLHKIDEIRFFNPDPNSASLGHVNHSYNPRNLYHLVGNFFISIGPLLIGGLCIYWITVFVFSNGIFIPFNKIDYFPEQIYNLQLLLNYLEGLTEPLLISGGILLKGQNYFQWEFYVFLYLLFSLGQSLRLSPEDMNGVFKGGGVIVIIVLLINILSFAIGINIPVRIFHNLTYLLTPFYSVMFFAIFVNMFFLIILIPSLKIVNVIKHH
jgi:hypothetical protein